MFIKPLIHLCTAVLTFASASSLIIDSSWAQTRPASADMVTVVVEVSLAANTSPSEALVALSEMRAMMKKQPGYLSEEFLQNLNIDNAPRFLHVSRWVSMTYWAALFRAPEFSKISQHGNQHYTISTSAYVPTE